MDLKNASTSPKNHLKLSKMRQVYDLSEFLTIFHSVNKSGNGDGLGTFGGRRPGDDLKIKWLDD